MKKIQVWLAAVLMAAGLGLVAPGPASATQGFCGIVWGSLAKVNTLMTQAQVTNVRTGQHVCYDRLVIDLNGKVAGYRVRYVPQVAQDGSGLPIALRGGAFLQVTVHAPAHDEYGQATFSPANNKEVRNVAGFQTFRQVAFAGSFEGHTTLGLGVRARLPFRVFTLDGPGGGSRLVVDVAHRW
ncbi:AMIN-like domain-containing (lipo)protein [Arthrobacter cavernae]|uniref:AMIN-like domain-containing protein n=1 Tax=Arthrobacter cavernae TaxID=2817681 RepID=A0A939HFQ8_9MICC|nr:hypothetical protein [Arthrobacter cavernae]MBO1267580.1 hypothetical protein [Arthrobacter cavernae]